MITPARLKRSLFTLQLLAWFQRAVRLGLRAAWLGAAGVLAAWSIQTVWGLLPDPITWAAVGVLFAIAPLIGIFFWRRSQDWLWSVDRKLGLKEQISTACTVASSPQPGPVGSALLEDAAALLPSVSRRILWRGWFLVRDLASMLVIAVLWGGVYIRYEAKPPEKLPTVIPGQAQTLPALPKEPTLQDLFPKGVLSLDPANAAQPASSTSGGGTNTASPNQGASAQTDLKPLLDSIQKVGQSLMELPITHDLGNALQNLDFNKAADQLESMADLTPLLPQATKESISKAMAQAGNALKQTEPAKALSADLSQAANALNPSPNSTSALPVGDAIDKVASDLRDLGRQASAASSADANNGASDSSNGQASNGGTPASGDTPGGGGSGASGGSQAQQGQAEPVGRLNGGTQQVNLTANGDQSLPGVLAPRAADETYTTNDTTTSGSGADQGTASTQVVEQPIFPYYYSWDWRDVVSEYFRRSH